MDFNGRELYIFVGLRIRNGSIDEIITVLKSLNITDSEADALKVSSLMRYNINDEIIWHYDKLNKNNNTHHAKEETCDKCKPGNTRKDLELDIDEDEYVDGFHDNPFDVPKKHAYIIYFETNSTWIKQSELGTGKIDLDDIFYGHIEYYYQVHNRLDPNDRQTKILTKIANILNISSMLSLSICGKGRDCTMIIDWKNK